MADQPQKYIPRKRQVDWEEPLQSQPEESNIPSNEVVTQGEQREKNSRRREFLSFSSEGGESATTPSPSREIPEEPEQAVGHSEEEILQAKKMGVDLEVFDQIGELEEPDLENLPEHSLEEIEQARKLGIDLEAEDRAEIEAKQAKLHRPKSRIKDEENFEEAIARPKSRLRGDREITEPVVEISSEPVVEEILEPVAEIEPVVEEIPEPVVEEIPEPVAEVEPVVEEIPEPVAEEPVVETIPETVAEAIPEAVVTKKLEPVAENGNQGMLEDFTHAVESLEDCEGMEDLDGREFMEGIKKAPKSRAIVEDTSGVNTVEGEVEGHSREELLQAKKLGIDLEVFDQIGELEEPDFETLPEHTAEEIEQALKMGIDLEAEDRAELEHKREELALGKKSASESEESNESGNPTGSNKPKPSFKSKHTKEEEEIAAIPVERLLIEHPINAPSTTSEKAKKLIQKSEASQVEVTLLPTEDDMDFALPNRPKVSFRSKGTRTHADLPSEESSASSTPSTSAPQEEVVAEVKKGGKRVVKETKIHSDDPVESIHGTVLPTEDDLDLDLSRPRPTFRSKQGRTEEEPEDTTGKGKPKGASLGLPFGKKK